MYASSGMIMRIHSILSAEHLPHSYRNGAHTADMLLYGRIFTVYTRSCYGNLFWKNASSVSATGAVAMDLTCNVQLQRTSRVLDRIVFWRIWRQKVNVCEFFCKFIAICLEMQVKKLYTHGMSYNRDLRLRVIKIYRRRPHVGSGYGVIQSKY